MPDCRCAGCGATMWSQYSSATMLHFCKDCGLKKSKPVIGAAREKTLPKET